MLGAFTPEQNCRMWNMFSRMGIDFKIQFKGTKSWSELWDFSLEMTNALKSIMVGKSADEWQSIFHRENLPAEKQRTIIEAVEDPQFLNREYFHRSEKCLGDTHAPLLPRAAYSLGIDGPEITSPPPAVGEHTLEILMDLGFSESELYLLRDEGVI
jgi:crotonobetainyl-CoA:carnitine CoA-transferase CaiB-like acyl-CoA transferase